MSSETWLVSGSSGGRNAAYRRTMEIIAEQNEQIERQRKLELTKHIHIANNQEALTATGQLLLNVAKLSIASSQPRPTSLSLSSSGPMSSPVSAQSPQVVVHPNSIGSSSMPRHSIGSLTEQGGPSARDQIQRLHVKPNTVVRHSRRQSSIDEIKRKRRRRETKQWKSGSLMLAGFANRQ
ncbi:hypothetical protein WR25_05564 [Diploscapter pachys]|uniref:Uncharacterized protein n=1 Tax=Diploscapter pachys TaxID=2018661 RepID=A0A2A2LSU3_9BILA|nr:hypothetical protein WR25_05564 [Diploscapter pachys]